jgi:hypothetical protein
MVAVLLACVLSREAASSTVSAISVPLAKVVFDSQLIVIGSVERVADYQSSAGAREVRGLKYYGVRIEEVLKSSGAIAAKDWKGQTIAVFDPQEMFYHEHADMIAAGVISFADPRYPTKVQKISAGDRLVFFLAGRDKLQKLPLPDACFLVCGQAYDTLRIKPAVLKRVK